MDKFLQDIQPDLGTSRVEEHVIRNAARESQKGVKKGSEAEKMKNLKKRISDETGTLFFIVHDEAHYAPLKTNLVDKLINDKAIRSARNVILLQVSATPYCLVTKNSRVHPTNRLDMYRLVWYDFLPWYLMVSNFTACYCNVGFGVRAYLHIFTGKLRRIPPTMELGSL